MKIGGFQKTSLLDYPGQISAIIWTMGCNFHCPFCYNIDLVNSSSKEFSEDEVLKYLEKRKSLIDGLVVTGGEPFLQKDLEIYLKTAIILRRCRGKQRAHSAGRNTFSMSLMMQQGNILPHARNAGIPSTSMWGENIAGKKKKHP